MKLFISRGTKFASSIFAQKRYFSSKFVALTIVEICLEFVLEKSLT